MNIKASGRSALIIAAGFWVCISQPLQAAEDADGGVTASRTETAAGPPVALSKFTKRSRLEARIVAAEIGESGLPEFHRRYEDFRKEDFGETENARYRCRFERR